MYTALTSSSELVFSTSTLFLGFPANSASERFERVSKNHKSAPSYLSSRHQWINEKRAECAKELGDLIGKEKTESSVFCVSIGCRNNVVICTTVSVVSPFPTPSSREISLLLTLLLPSMVDMHYNYRTRYTGSGLRGTVEIGMYVSSQFILTAQHRIVIQQELLIVGNAKLILDKRGIREIQFELRVLKNKTRTYTIMCRTLSVYLNQG